MESIKCIIVGDGSVGKSSLLMRYCVNCFPENYVPTVFDNYSAKVISDDKPINLSLWDTAGQEDYDAIRPLSYNDADIFLLAYSIIQPTSFININSKWYPEINHYCPGVPFMLVGTKYDLKNDAFVSTHMKNRNLNIVTQEDAQQLCNSISAKMVVECSALSGYGISNVFNNAIKTVLLKRNTACKTEYLKKSKCVIL
jgi:small GTP-binding protein